MPATAPLGQSKDIGRLTARFEQLLEADNLNDSGAVARLTRSLADEGIRVRFDTAYRQSDEAPHIFRRYLAALVARDPITADEQQEALDALGIRCERDPSRWPIAWPTPRGAA